MTTPPAQPLATLTSWLGAAGDSHPIRPRLASTDPDIRHAVNDLDALLATIEAAQPNRWMGKRRDFRSLRDDQQYESLHAELLVAARLCRARITFEFGKPGTPQPDLVLPTQNLGIEVTSPTPGGAWHLGDELEKALADADLPTTVILRFSEQPLKIPPPVRATIVDRILATARLGGGSFTHEIFTPRPDRTALIVQVMVSSTSPLADQPRVSWSIEGSLLTPHLTDIETEIENVLTNERKVRQSLSMPSLLVIDLAQAGAAWLRPLEVWASRLSQLVTSTSPYLGVAAMFPDLGNDVKLALAVRPGVTDQEAEPIHQLTRALGLASPER